MCIRDRKIIDVNNKEGFILLEDFGDKIFSTYMNKEKTKSLKSLLLIPFKRNLDKD